VFDPNHINDWNVIQVENEGDLQVELVCIMDQKVKALNKKSIGMVNIQWICYGPKYATWEHEDAMQEEYSKIFE